MKKAAMILMTTFIFLLSGCSGDKASPKQNIALMNANHPDPILLHKNKGKEDISNDIKQDLSKRKEVKGVAVVQGEKQILVAYKVKHRYRFKMEAVEKSIKEYLENDFPRQKFVVSSDYKIFLEVVRLKEKIEHNKLSQKDANKEFNDIVRLAKELT